MTRPITLFTGQWADLPFEEMCRLASEWGYDGLEIACWGDHFEVDKAAQRRHVRRRPARTCSRSTTSTSMRSPTTSSARPSATTRSTSGTRGILPPRIWGDGDPEGVRQRAAEEMKDTARAAAKLGVNTVVGFTGSKIWKTVAMFPPVPAVDDRRRLSGLRRPVEPDPRRLRRGRRPVRPRGAPERDRLRLLDDGRARSRRSGTGRRSASTGTRATSSGRTSTRSGSSGTSRTGSITWTARTRSARSATAATAGWARTSPWADPRRGWDFVSTGHGDVPWEACFRMLNTIGYDGPISIEWEDAGMDRLVGAPEALEFVRRLAFDPPTASFDAAFSSGG